MPPETITIGKSEARKDGWTKASGQALYVGDIPIKHVCIGAVLRSPHHHARILAIDPSPAQMIPGVVAVITAKDIPGEKIHGPLVQDQPVLAMDIVRHMGEPIALVVTEDKTAAEKALAAIQVEYEPLPAVFDAEKALQPGAPQVHPGGNLLCEYDVSDGDLQEGFSQAEVILEETFQVPRISPAYLEAESSLAYFDEDGTLTVVVSSQKPFDDRHHIAMTCGLQDEQVRVKSAVVGGAFGGKEDSELHILAGLAAWITKRPVRFLNNRWESFLAHPKRHPATLHYKLGAKADGTLIALEALVHMDTGAYASYGPAVGGLLTEMVQGAYHIPNLRVLTRVVYTNSPYSGAMRGFGSPQAHFATESMLDILASRLAMDPLELRRKNILQPEDHFFTRVQVGDTARSLPLILAHADQARQRLRQLPAAPGKQSGVGFALSLQSMGLGHRVPDDSTNRLEWSPEGRLIVYLGSPELGQGMQTAVEQIAAETLGIPYQIVDTIDVDSRISPNGGVTCASRMTYLLGNSVILAAHKLTEETLNYAARTLNLPRAKLEYRLGQVILPDGRQMPVSEFCGRAAEDGIVLGASATFSFPYPAERTPEHLPIGMPHMMHAFGANVVRVEVDPELGTVEVKDMVAIHDVGRVINRAGVEGQVEGGAVMAMGYALYEDVCLKENQRWVDSFTEYLIPTARDIPENIEVILLELPELSGPFGVKGIAEMGLVPVAPAIANAVFEAVGVRARELPITPEKIALSLVEG
ncbi:MAG: aerobic-type carbon monoxide dehydrogenase, large subunit CoxL/CutL-like protein [Chloroflexi bacterium]|nr:aerobic-type carbon monoxide dehydrogenase, large subunit CoxL/CutL-like protein [Chloroflexota bacterium]